MRPTPSALLVAASLLAAAGTAHAFENTKVLPKGVRNVNLRSVNTDFDEKTNGSGQTQPLAEPLAQSLTFHKIAKGETELKGNQLRAFLLSNDFKEDDSVGDFTADLKGHLQVFAPIVSYGLTSKFTVALAAPIYTARTSVQVGFRPNDNARRFLTLLANDHNAQTASAREAGDKLNNAVSRLNTKLVDHGYSELKEWNGQGMGDMTLAGKFLHHDSRVFAVATTTGVVAPTGRVDDPDVLTDVAFGDGQWDAFSQVGLDEKLGLGFRLNQFTKYTAQLPGQKTVRAQYDDEKIEVDYTRTRFKLGDKVDAGTSLQYEPAFGLVAGVGYTFFHKFGDLYRGDIAPDTKSLLERNSEQKATNAEMQLGYSTVPLYQAGTFAVPLDLKLTYTRQLTSRNMPITDLAQLDFNLYF